MVSIDGGRRQAAGCDREIHRWVVLSSAMKYEMTRERRVRGDG